MNLKALEHKLPANILDEIPSLEKFGLNTDLRLAHFLSQTHHESGGFKTFRENLNYSTDGLMKVFPKYFPNEIIAGQYQRNQVKIGSRVYANRMGNGDERSEDGYKYKGRGALQLTGKDNYKAFSDFVGEDVVSNPDLVASKFPLTSGAWFFKKNNLWAICDLGTGDEVVKQLTKRVNGGLHGYDDRLSKFKMYLGFVQPK